jgi:hypothetical protein
MIINKSTSNSLLVNSLVVYNTDSSPLLKLKEFNTSTLVAICKDDSTVAAGCFSFLTYTYNGADAIKALLSEDLHSYVRAVPQQLEPFVGSLAQADADPDYFLFVGEEVKARLAKCGQCNEQFIVWLDGAGNVWSAGKANDADKHPKAVKLTTLVCDACSELLLLRR